MGWTGAMFKMRWNKMGQVVILMLSPYIKVSTNYLRVLTFCGYAICFMLFHYTDHVNDVLGRACETDAPFISLVHAGIKTLNAEEKEDEYFRSKDMLNTISLLESVLMRCLRDGVSCSSCLLRVNGCYEQFQ